MRSITTIALSLSLSTVAFAQDNSSNNSVSQQDLNAVFQAGTAITKQNVLSKQESKETVGGTTCVLIITGDSTGYELCF